MPRVPDRTDTSDNTARIALLLVCQVLKSHPTRPRWRGSDCFFCELTTPDVCKSENISPVANPDSDGQLQIVHFNILYEFEPGYLTPVETFMPLFYLFLQ